MDVAQNIEKQTSVKRKRFSMLTLLSTDSKVKNHLVRHNKQHDSKLLLNNLQNQKNYQSTDL